MSFSSIDQYFKKVMGRSNERASESRMYPDERHAERTMFIEL